MPSPHGTVIGGEIAGRDPPDVLRTGEDHAHGHRRLGSRHSTKPRFSRLPTPNFSCLRSANRMAACSETATAMSPSATPHQTELSEKAPVSPVAAT
jgi:hypothetical protein